MSAFIADRLAGGRTFSIEVFPPKTDDGQAALDATLDALSVLPLDFVSVTYGAGGSDRDRTMATVSRLLARDEWPVMPHLTCVGHSRADIDRLLATYSGDGVRNVLALAGDPPPDGSDPGGDFHYATDLIEVVRAETDFSVGVAAHPECHPRSIDRAEDRRHLATKLAQADFGITQFFFDADHYFRMVDELAALGCDTPVLPGVMPLVTPVSVRRFAAMANAEFPEKFAQRVVETDDENERLALIVEAAVTLSQRLLDGGAPGLHLYCLNRSPATLAIAEGLGLIDAPNG